MPKYNVTLDNTSPLIQYVPGTWREGDAASDPFWQKYDRGTFTVAETNSSSASFRFNGTGVWLYGAKRGNHGLYNITFDNQITTYNGKNDPELFQTVLYNATNLPQAAHTMAITNYVVVPDLHFFDIDYIVWESSIGLPSEAITQTMVDDPSPAFVYSPPERWSTNPADVSVFQGQTGHITFFDGASVTFTFRGDAVSLVGAIGPQMAPYSVQIDGSPPFSYNATKDAQSPMTMLYHANNLGPGQHVLKVVNQPFRPGQALAIDFATVFTVPSVPTTDAQNSVTQTNNNKPALGAAALGSIVAVITVAVLGAIITFVLLWRRRRLRRRIDDTKESSQLIDPLPIPLQISNASTSFLSSQPPDSQLPFPWEETRNNPIAAQPSTATGPAIRGDTPPPPRSRKNRSPLPNQAMPHARSATPAEQATSRDVLAPGPPPDESPPDYNQATQPYISTAQGPGPGYYI